jgi:hypothetical protein
MFWQYVCPQKKLFDHIIFYVHGKLMIMDLSRELLMIND